MNYIRCMFFVFTFLSFFSLLTQEVYAYTSCLKKALESSSCPSVWPSSGSTSSNMNALCTINDGTFVQITSPRRYEAGSYWCDAPTGGAWQYRDGVPASVANSERYPCMYEYRSCTLDGNHTSLVYLCRSSGCSWYCDGVDTGKACTEPDPSLGSSFSCPAGKDSVGGCGTPKYCEGTDTYNQAIAFLGFLSGIKTFTYENWIGSNGISYICVNTAILSSGRTMLYINSSAGQEPAFLTNNACVSKSAYNAINNTVCDTSGTTVLNGKNTNIYKSVGSTGLTTLCKNADGTYVNCPGSVSTEMGGGVTITQDPTGVGSTTVTSPTGGTNPDGTPTKITQPVTKSGTGAGTTISGLNTGNCYDGIKNGDEITADKGGRCIGITTGAGAGTGAETDQPPITWGGSYTGGTGSGHAPFSSSSVSDNSELKTLVSGFLNSMKASSFFSMPSSLFQSFPSGGSPDITFNAGRYGTHTYNFSSAWASIIPLLKGIIIAVFAVVAVKVVVLKGGGG